MNHQSYFILTSGEDGISISMVSEAELKKSLNRNEYGDKVKFLDHIPEIDKGCWYQDEDEETILIIKGAIVVPKPVKKVTEYEVE